MADLAYRRAYPLPAGFTVAFVLDGGRLVAEWSPDVPVAPAKGRLIRAYRRARNDFLKSLNMSVMVIEA